VGKIIISENLTLDGVIQDPAGDEGFKHGGWVGRIGDRGREEAAKAALDEALGTEAMLLGRRTYQFLAARWPSRTGALADRLNNKAKYVVSETRDKKPMRLVGNRTVAGDLALLTYEPIRKA